MTSPFVNRTQNDAQRQKNLDRSNRSSQERNLDQGVVGNDYTDFGILSPKEAPHVDSNA